MLVSVILPVFNAAEWLPQCLQSISDQTHLPLEVSVFDDRSTDNSVEIISFWRDNLKQPIKVLIVTSNLTQPGGGDTGLLLSKYFFSIVGYARNQAISNSSGEYLCFLDADDFMHPERIKKQLNAAVTRHNWIIGSKFSRIPYDSTKRFSDWGNNTTAEQLYTQAFTSHGPTLLMPTWFCHRSVYEKVGKFDESGKGTPEDLIFFYEHLRRGGELYRVDEDLLTYRYHPTATTFSVHEETIWGLRVRFLEERILLKWPRFSIWSAGKQGRKLYRSLDDNLKKRVIAFCDVDAKKIAKGFYTDEESLERPKPRIPIVSYATVQPPVVVCVKLDLTNGNLERNIAELNLVEGRDYIHFN